MSAQTFSLLGMTIDYSSAQIEGSFGNGSFVKIDGRIDQGSIVAREVELELDDDRDENFEGFGVIENLNSTNRTFELFGFLVDFSNAELEASLANGLEVEVEGLFNDGNIDAEEVRRV